MIFFSHLKHLQFFFRRSFCQFSYISGMQCEIMPGGCTIIIFVLLLKKLELRVSQVEYPSSPKIPSMRTVNTWKQTIK